MCVDCLRAVEEIFPEVPIGEVANFLYGATAYPFDTADNLREQLVDLRSKMTTDDWRECYGIADAATEAAMQTAESQESNVPRAHAGTDSR